MIVRAFVRLLVLIAAAVTPAAARAGTAVRVGGPTSAPAVAPGFVGLAFEYADAMAYVDPSGGPNPAIEQLVRNLAPGGVPIVRIGGHSGDHAYVPGPGVPHSLGLQLPLSRGYIAALARFVRDIGGQLMLGINLEVNDPRVAGLEARSLVAGIGRRYIRSFQLGNEPSLYGSFAWYRDTRHVRRFARGPGWSIPRYLQDFAASARSLPRLPLGGPDLPFNSVWAPHLGEILASTRVSEATLHGYAGNACYGKPGTLNYASVPNLLRPEGSRGLARRMSGEVRTARRHGATVRIDEFATESCGGKRGVSDVFAASLWELDTLFALAATGVDGVSLQTFPGAPYALFSAGQSGGRSWAAAAPGYYGLLMFARAAPAGSRLLRVTAAAGQEEWLRGWATRASDGSLRVLLLNDSSRTAHTVSLRVPGADGERFGSLERLTAPSVTARTGITLAGQSFGERTYTGSLSGTPAVSPVIARRGQVVLGLPAGSATLVTFPAG